ncbi:MAG: carboxypeptidase-like regulatory domain-containing protein [Anaerolineae bacterium]
MRLWVLLVPALLLLVISSAAAAGQNPAAAALGPGAGTVLYLPLLERNADPLGPASTPPPLSFVLTGLVYDFSVGPGKPIAGADVSISTCENRAFHVTTDATGRYALSAPLADLNRCPQVTLGAAAAGYTPQYLLTAVSDVISEAERNIGLAPLSGPQPTVVPGPW